MSCGSFAGLGQKRGLVVFGFDECGAPRPETPGEPTYFQRGLSSLVPWRWEEANRRFDDGAAARDLLPVVVISGSHSAHMNLLKTASGYARIYNLGRPILRDESLVSIAMDAVQRIAGATGTAVPGSAEEVRFRPQRPMKGDHLACQGAQKWARSWAYCWKLLELL
jgi:hypothetical protein